MNSKKEQELLRDILPVLLKYDFATIENCIDYLVKNKQQLPSFLAFINGGTAEIQNGRNKRAIDDVLLTAEKEKSTVIKRIYKYLSGKRFTYEQIHHISTQYLEEKSVSARLDADNKSELLLVLAHELANLPIEVINDFEYYIQVHKRTENENTLENWSKVIVKNQA